MSFLKYFAKRDGIQGDLRHNIIKWIDLHVVQADISTDVALDGVFLSISLKLSK